MAQRPHEHLGAQDGFCAPWMEPGCSRDVDIVRSLKRLLQQSLSGQRQEGGWEAGSLKGPGGVSRTGERLHMEGVEFLDEWPIALHEVGWPNATSTKQPPRTLCASACCPPRWLRLQLSPLSPTGGPWPELCSARCVLPDRVRVQARGLGPEGAGWVSVELVSSVE